MKWRLLLCLFLCGCTVTVAPIPKKQQLRRESQVKHRHKEQHTVVNDATTVSREWMRDYRNLEAKYGEITADDEISVTDGGFKINNTIKSRYDLMKRIETERQQGTR